MGIRILFFIDSLGAGGKERRLVELMKGLSDYPEILFGLVTLSDDIHYVEAFDIGVNIYRIVRKSKKDFYAFQEAHKICKEFRPNIIHCWDSMTAVYVTPISKLLKAKLVNGMVSDAPVKRNFLNKSWLRARLTFPFSDAIVGNSRAGLLAYGAPRTKSLCVYNGIDLNRLKNLKEPSSVRSELFGDGSSSVFVVGMVAAFEDKKDQRTLINAAKSLISQYDHMRFVFVGGGSTFFDVKNIVPAELLSKIVFLGIRSDVESIVNIFDVGVLLTNDKVHGEGISNAILEYMALGKPVIATRGGGTDEIVIHNQSGFLIDSGATNELIECIQILSKDRSMIEGFGRKGNQIVLKRFDLRIMTNQYVKLYQNLTSVDLLH